ATLDAKLLVERLGAGLPAQELLQRLHLVAAAALLEHRVSVPPTLLAVHGVLLEYRVEHVGREHVGEHVAVVAGVVAANEVAERSLAIAPVAAPPVSFHYSTANTDRGRRRKGGRGGRGGRGKMETGARVNLLALAERLGPLETADLAPQLIVHLRNVQPLKLIMRLGRVDR